MKNGRHGEVGEDVAISDCVAAIEEINGVAKGLAEDRGQRLGMGSGCG